MADTVQADPIDPAIVSEPAPEVVLDPPPPPVDVDPEPDAPADVVPLPPVDADPEPAPEPEAETDALARFRMHWRGGEHWLALELVKAGKFAEDEFAALVNEFPEIIDILNQ